MGTDISLETEGLAVAEPMAAMGYDAMAIGVMDAVKGLDALRAVEETGLTLLSANIVDATTGDLVFTPYVLLEEQGKTIALLGLSDDDVLLAPGMDGVIDILDPIEQAKALVSELAEQADIIVVISHLGVDLDEQLAAAVPDIDIVIGGNSQNIPDQPEIVGSTVMARIEAYGSYVGRLTVKFSADNAITDVGAEAIHLDSTIPEDSNVAAIVQKWVDLYPTPTADPAITETPAAITY